MSQEQDHTLLLQAAVLPRESALDAWREWSAQYQPSDIEDFAVSRIFPLVYKRLHVDGVKDGVKDRHTPILKMAYQRAWYKNQMLFAEAERLLLLLEKHGIRTLLLKGLHLTLSYYGQPGVRPMGDVDVMVHRSDLEQAIHLLEEIGWQAKDPIPHKGAAAAFESHLCNDHALSLYNSKGQSVDLHWNLLHEWTHEDSNNTFWDNAVDVSFNRVQMLGLQPADLLFHIMVHAKHEFTITASQWYWAVDAMTVLQKTGTTTDWTRIIELAKERCVLSRVKTACRFLSEVCAAPIEPSVLESIEKTKLPRAERMELYYGERGDSGPLGGLPARWAKFRRRYPEDSKSPLAFLHYMKTIWNVDRSWKLLFVLPTKLLTVSSRWILSKLRPRRERAEEAAGVRQQDARS